MEKQKKYSISDYLFFILPSCLGLFFFLTPMKFGEKTDIAVGFVAKKILSFLSQSVSLFSHIEFTLINALLFITIFLTFVFGVVAKFLPKRIVYKYPALLFFHVPTFWFIVRSLGFFITMSCFFKIGPEFIWHKETGTFLLQSLIPSLFCIFFCAGLLLPLLLDFGLLQFVGVFLTKVMRPVFTLPGRSSIDCLSSWVGDGSIAILLTNKQYEGGFYSKREATVIATTFSFVSITFCFVVLAHAQLEHLAGPYYLTIILSGLVAAVVCPRIPPLSWVEDSYYTKKRVEEDVKGLSARQLYQIAIDKALSHAKKSFSFKGYFMNAFKSVLEMWTGVLTPIMCFGTISLVIANYTPIFKYLGLLFYPLLLLLQVPEALEASQAMILGFSDMFLPVIVSSSIKSDFTRFVIASVSVSQLIFMSEVGSLLLSSKMDIKFKDLVAIFFLRTLITLPIIVLCAHFVF